MRRIVVSLLKGGVAKSETAVSLAHGLALKGHKVLLVDTDVQAQCNDMLGVEPEKGLAELIAGWASPEEALFEARENLWLLAGGVPLAGVKMEIARREMAPEAVLDETLSCYEDDFDVMVMDTAPGWDTLLVNALYCCREVISPVSMEPVALKGLRRFEERLSVIQKYQPDLALKWIVPTFVDGRVKKTAHIMEQLQAEFGDRLTDSIRYSVKLSEAPEFGKTIYEHDPRGTGAKGYKALVERVLREAPKENAFISLEDIKYVVKEPASVQAPVAVAKQQEPEAAVASHAATEPAPKAPAVSPKFVEPAKQPEQAPATLQSEASAEPEEVPYMPPPAPENKPEQVPPARQELSPAEPEPAPYVIPPAPNTKPQQLPAAAATAQRDAHQSTPVPPPPKTTPEPDHLSMPVTPGIQRMKQPDANMAATRPHQEAPPIQQRPAPPHASAARHEELPPWLRPQPEAGQDKIGISPKNEVTDQERSRPLSARLQRPAPPKEKEPAPTDRKLWDLRERFKKMPVLSQRLTKGMNSGSR